MSSCMFPGLPGRHATEALGSGVEIGARGPEHGGLPGWDIVGTEKMLVSLYDHTGGL